MILQERAHSSLASYAARSVDGDVAPAPTTGDIPGLPTGIAVRTGENVTRNARRAARWYSQHGRGARFQALRHAQGQMFGSQPQYFGHTSPNMFHPAKEVPVDSAGQFFDGEFGPPSGEYGAAPIPVSISPLDPVAVPYVQPIGMPNADMFQWSANMSDSSYGSTPENPTQQELQTSWSDFLSAL
jgi:hypothetical protein